jgi:hypothetical protein
MSAADFSQKGSRTFGFLLDLPRPQPFFPLIFLAKAGQGKKQYASWAFLRKVAADFSDFWLSIPSATPFYLNSRRLFLRSPSQHINAIYLGYKAIGGRDFAGDWIFFLPPKNGKTNGGLDDLCRTQVDITVVW